MCRPIIEGSSFTCELSAARWRLSEEKYKWSRRLKQGEFCDLLSDEDEWPSSKEAADLFGPGIELGAPQPHVLVQRMSEFLLRMIYERRIRKFYVDDRIENQPLEGMIEAAAEANTQLAEAMARSERDVSNAEKVVQGLKLARWSLAQASESADLAHHMGSADSDWLDGLRREFSALRHEIRCQILRYQEDMQTGEPTSEMRSSDSPSSEQTETVELGSEKTTSENLP